MSFDREKYAREYYIINKEKLNKQQKENNQKPEVIERRKEREKNYYKKNKNRIDKYKEDWNKKNVDKIKKRTKIYNLNKRYGLSLKDYNNLLLKQKSKCGICSIEPNNFLLVVDHNHKTNEVRGLLCVKCNWGLGNFNDNILLLKQSIEYINQYTR